jgi:hypothetical protein
VMRSATQRVELNPLAGSRGAEARVRATAKEKNAQAGDCGATSNPTVGRSQPVTALPAVPPVGAGLRLHSGRTGPDKVP